MAACVVCLRPVVMNAVQRSDGEICHRACQHLPRAERPASRVQKAARKTADDFFDQIMKRPA